MTVSIIKSASRGPLPLPSPPPTADLCGPSSCRELADQTRSEAVKLLTFLPHLGVQMVIGGTNLKSERNALSSRNCTVLVATPGRLQDHIDETPGFAQRLKVGPGAKGRG